jgi:predicted alpha/beta-fold hydrolase
MKPKLKMTLIATFCFIVVISGGLVYFIGETLRYRKLPGDDGFVHQVAKKAICREWHTEYEFKDSDKKDLSPNCQESLEFKSTDYFVSSPNGNIHLKEFSLEEPAQTQIMFGAPKPIWLHVHGITGNWLSAARYIEPARKLGFRLFGMDLSNHGESSNDGKGAFWGCREASDIVSVVKFLKSKAPPLTPIAISAVSMGTLAVALAESKLRTLGVTMFLLEAPIEKVQNTLPFWSLPFAFAALKMRSFQEGYDLTTCNASNIISQFKTPTLLVTVEHDPFIKTSDVKKYLDSLPNELDKKLVVFAKGLHTLAYNFNKVEFIDEFYSFFLNAWNKSYNP